MRVQWSCSEELAADDVLDCFSAYGKIAHLDWLENADKSDTSVEETKLFCDESARVAVAMHAHKHQISREADGKKITVTVSVKFSDHVVT